MEKCVKILASIEKVTFNAGSSKIIESNGGLLCEES